MANTSSVEYWENLRKEARHIENEVDAKLVAISKLGIDMKPKNTCLESEPLLEKEHVFENIFLEIESLISKLTLINKSMSEIQPNDAGMLHIIQRHREILIDYKSEFKKTKTIFASKINREDSSNKIENINYQEIKGLSRRDMHVKEHQHLHRSNNLINDQISIAMETKDRLVSQRNTFKRIQHRLINVFNQFPAINSLLRKINLRKRRDSIIIGFTISVCVILILLFMFH